MSNFTKILGIVALVLAINVGAAEAAGMAADGMAAVIAAAVGAAVGVGVAVGFRIGGPITITMNRVTAAGCA